MYFSFAVNLGFKLDAVLRFFHVPVNKSN
jgi:hypothetical protein